MSRTLIESARAGDDDAFTSLTAGHRRELQVHCYRLLGSLEDAEDAVQETFLRAWSRLETYRGQSSLRAWLYGIATNVCLDGIRRRRARVWASDVLPPADPHDEPAPPTELAWIQPYPDRLLPRSPEGDPDTSLVAKETIELIFLAAVQRLPPRQRAILVLRDVLEWSARETAEALEISVPAANSALQRARATMVQHLPAHERARWRAPSTASERALLERLVRAWERADADALVALLHPDARLVMPPRPTWFAGRHDVGVFFRHHVFGVMGQNWQLVPTRANRQPAFGLYWCPPGEVRHQQFAVAVLGLSGDSIRELAVFVEPRLFAHFELPASG